MREELIYRGILENMHDGVMTIDLDGRIITFNSAAEVILGMARHDVLHKPFAAVFLEKEQNDDFNQAILNAVYESEMIHNSIVSFSTDQRTVTLAVTTSFLQSGTDDARKNTAVIVVFHDISEVMRLRDAEVKLTEELKQQHGWLQKAYMQLEESNRDLQAALKKVQVIRIVATVFIIILFFSAGIYGFRTRVPEMDAGTEKTGLKNAAVHTVTVVPASLSDGITLAGVLKPLKIINVTSPFDGAVDERLFSYGQSVKAGDLLIRMDTRDVSIKHRDAKVAYIKAVERLAELKNWDAGSEVANARRSLSRAKLNLETQQKELDQVENLFRKGIVAASEHERTKQQLATSQMDFDSASEQLASALQKGNPENVNVAKLELENARLKLEELEQQLRHANVYASVSGIIILPESKNKEDKKTVERGVGFHQGEVLVSIGDMEGISITAEVDEIEVIKVKQGQKVRISGDAFPGITLNGTVSHISSQAVKGEGSQGLPAFEVVVAVEKLTEKETSVLRLGMTANFEIIVYEKPDALLVPISAVMVEDGTRTIMLKNKETNELTKVTVVTGITTPESVEILEGLKPGDEIVVGH